MISEKEWHTACYYAVREDFNNNLSGQKRTTPFIDKKMDAKIRAGISAFLVNTMPYPSSIVELDAIYNCMHRRGIVDPRDPSNQQTLKFKGYARRRRKAA